MGVVVEVVARVVGVVGVVVIWWCGVVMCKPATVVVWCTTALAQFCPLWSPASHLLSLPTNKLAAPAPPAPPGLDSQVAAGVRAEPPPSRAGEYLRRCTEGTHTIPHTTTTTTITTTTGTPPHTTPTPPPKTTPSNPSIL